MGEYAAKKNDYTSLLNRNNFILYSFLQMALRVTYKIVLKSDKNCKNQQL